MDNVEHFLSCIAQINFLASIILLFVVIHHYLFFSQGTPNDLTKWVKRVFLADAIMATSVISFNLTQFFMTPAEYNEMDALRVSLKVAQLVSVLYATWANYGLFRHIGK